MPLLRYQKATGQIFGVYEASLPELLAAQHQGADETWGVLEVEASFPTHEQERWEVRDGQVQARQDSPAQPVSTERPSAFQAERLAWCTVLCEELNHVRKGLGFPLLTVQALEAAVQQAKRTQQTKTEAE